MLEGLERQLKKYAKRLSSEEILRSDRVYLSHDLKI